MSSLRRRKTLAGVATSALVLAALVTATPASASGPAPGSAPAQGQAAATSLAVEAPVTKGLLPRAATKTRAQLEATGGHPEVIDYWTAERMAAAIPVRRAAGAGPDYSPRPNELPAAPEPLPAERPSILESESAPLSASAHEPAQEETRLPLAGSGPSARSGPSVVEPAPATEPARARLDTATGAQPTSRYSPATGKVFFHNPLTGRDYMCSGAAVNSGSKRLVSTAAHCVHGGPGGTWFQNWVFIPSYHEGTRPYGTFAAKTLRILKGWAVHGAQAEGFDADVAFVTTYPNHRGASVVNAVGGHGLWAQSERVFSANVFGYPSNLNSGEVQRACAGVTEILRLDAYPFSTVRGCDFGSGSSGGPWLHKYRERTGLGYVRGVTSFGPRDSTSYISAASIDRRGLALYALANRDRWRS